MNEQSPGILSHDDGFYAKPLCMDIERRHGILLLMENGMKCVNSKMKLNGKNKCHW